MRINRSVPPGSVVPVLAYPDVASAVEFLTAALGCVERTRIGESHRSQLAVGEDGAIIVAESRTDTSLAPSDRVTHLIRVRVTDADAAFARARDSGARVIEPPVDREYGERDCTIEDPWGHRWQLAETVSDVAPEDFGCTTVSAWPAYES